MLSAGFLSFRLLRAARTTIQIELWFWPHHVKNHSYTPAPTYPLEAPNVPLEAPTDPLEASTDPLVTKTDPWEACIVTH